VASADNNEDTGIIETSSNTSNDDLAMNEQVAESEQEQFDEVKDIQRKAAEKEPYKRSYTAKADSEPVTKATSKKSSARDDDQTTRRQASKANSSSWRSRNAKYAEKESNHKSRRNETAERSSKRSKSSKHSKPKQPSEVTVQKGE
jgi:hypothetical protein